MDDGAYVTQFQFFSFIADYIGSEHDLFMFFEQLLPPETQLVIQ